MNMKKVFFSFVATVFLLLNVETASACICFLEGKPTPQTIRKQNDDLNKADFVFSGEVIKFDTFTVVFRIEKVWKGETVEEITMATKTKAKGNGLLTFSSCDYNFNKGEKYLVYAEGSGGNMQSYKCAETGQLKNSDDRIKFLREIKLQ